VHNAFEALIFFSQKRKTASVFIEDGRQPQKNNATKINQEK
jgi:hypothetical protein